MNHQPGSPASGTIQAAKRRLSRQLLTLRAIAGVGIVRLDPHRLALKVYLAIDDPATRALVPSEVDGYPVTIEVVGLIAARAAPSVRSTGTGC